jgi:hypothetical protein
VDFVDDVHLVFGGAWCSVHPVAQVTDFVDPAVGSRIDLDDIQMSLVVCVWQAVDFVR